MGSRFQLVDVFSEQPYGGNPVAVVLDGEGLDADAMMRITRWLNLSETTFLQPSTVTEADYRVRIFTLERELPFAGHPTLGSAHAWLTAGGTPQDAQAIVQECGAGLVRIRREEDRLLFAAPPRRRSGPLPAETLAEVTAALEVSPGAVVESQWCDNGPGWAAVLLESANEVLALRPRHTHPVPLYVGAVGPYPPGSPEAFEVRAFFTDQHGALREDRVTGSLNAAVAQWLVGNGRVHAPYVASQGTCMGCQGRVHVAQDLVGQIWVGGVAHTLFSGEAELGGQRPARPR